MYIKIKGHTYFSCVYHSIVTTHHLLLDQIKTRKTTDATMSMTAVVGTTQIQRRKRPRRDSLVAHDSEIFNPTIIKLIPVANISDWISAAQEGSAAAAAATVNNSNRNSSVSATSVLGLHAWRYSIFLLGSLIIWVLYLLLPRGVRKEYFRAHPRRYAKSTAEARKQGVGQWIFPTSTNTDDFDSSCSNTRATITSSMFSGSVTEKYLAEHARARKLQLKSLQQDSREESSTREESIFGMSSGTTCTGSRQQHPSPVRDSITSSSISNNFGRDRYDTGTRADSSIGSGWADFKNSRKSRSKPQQEEGATTFTMPSIGESSSTKTPPSPKHPSISRVPNNSILSETMMRLADRGIRLVAHGVQCEPKRVWIRIDEETMNLSWQTEFPRRVAGANGQMSIVLMRGTSHNIALPNVLYIDVGKRTNALQRRETMAIPDSVCFSLLTQNGSLDLQTNSMLERDALVSCFSVLLDYVHKDRDWRLLYEEGNSSVVTGSDFLSNDMMEI